MTYESIRKNAAARVYIQQADASLAALGYTEHSFPHVERVADCAGSILTTLGYSARAKPSWRASPDSCMTSATWSTAPSTVKAAL